MRVHSEGFTGGNIACCIIEIILFVYNLQLFFLTLWRKYRGLFEYSFKMFPDHVKVYSKSVLLVLKQFYTTFNTQHNLTNKRFYILNIILVFNNK